MREFTISFEDCRWPDLPALTLAVRAEDRVAALDEALIIFRHTFPLANLAHYVAMCAVSPPSE